MSENEGRVVSGPSDPAHRATVWARVLLVLVGFWVLVHGPRLPATLPARDVELVPLLLGVALAGALLGVLTVVGLLATPDVRAPIRIFGAPGRAYIGTVMAVLGVSFGLESLLALLDMGGQGELGNMSRLFAELGPSERAVAALCLALGPGITEELAFRGFVLGRISAVSGPQVATLVSAVAFGLFHFDPIQVGLTAVLGVILGWATVRSGALGPAMLAHGMNNAASVVGAGFELSNPERVGLIMSSVALAAVGARVVVGRRRGLTA